MFAGFMREVVTGDQAMTAQPVLSDTVFVAASLCPQILRAAIKAKYGKPAEQLVRLKEARALLRQLDAKLALTEAAVTAAAAPIAEKAS